MSIKMQDRIEDSFSNILTALQEQDELVIDELNLKAVHRALQLTCELELPTSARGLMVQALRQRCREVGYSMFRVKGWAEQILERECL